MADNGGISGQFDAQDVACLLGCTARAIRKRATKESWPFREVPCVGGRRRVFARKDLPADVSQKLILAELVRTLRDSATDRSAAAPLDAAAPATRPAIDDGIGDEPLSPAPRKVPSQTEIESRSARYARLPARYRAEAERRLAMLDSVEELVREGQRRSVAQELVAARASADGGGAVHVSTLRRWASDVRVVPRPFWLHYLAPRWVGRVVSAEIPPAAWDAFKADYLRPEAPSASACYQRLRRMAPQQGWRLAHCRTFQRRITRDIHPAALVLARQGEEAMMRLFPAQERDKRALSALEAVNADGHRIDVFVKHPLGHVCRPILVAFQDVYSGAMLAWRWGETESADLVRLALRDLVHAWGIPHHAWLDNGRAFASKFITGGTRSRYRFKVRAEDPTGIAVALGIQIHWATPYHGQAKPIERGFRDLCESVAKHPAFAGAYVGNSPEAKPENYGQKAIEWADFVRIADAEIRAHNLRDGRRSLAAGGRSLLDTFNESYQRTPIRRASLDQLRDLLLAADAVTASSTDGSVRLAGNRYWTEGLSHHVGKRLMVRFDPDALHTGVEVCALDGTFIAQAPCIAAVGFADAAAATEHQRARNQFKRATKAALKAERRMTVAQLADQMAAVPETPYPLAKPTVLAPVFQRKRPQRPTLPEESAATGTDGYVSAMDELVRRRMEAMPRRRDPND